MRKVLFLLLAAAMTATAQDAEKEKKPFAEHLRRIEVKADPALGTKDKVVWQSRSLTMNEELFGGMTLNNKVTSHIFVKGKIIVAFYDADGNFLCKGEALMPRIWQGAERVTVNYVMSKDSMPYSKFREKGDILSKNTWRLSAPTIVRWMKESGGQLRIVAPMYGGRHLDMRFELRKENEE